MCLTSRTDRGVIQDEVNDPYSETRTRKTLMKLNLQNKISNCLSDHLEHHIHSNTQGRISSPYHIGKKRKNSIVLMWNFWRSFATTSYGACKQSLLLSHFDDWWLSKIATATCFTWCWVVQCSDPSSSYKHQTLWAGTCTSQKFL